MKTVAIIQARMGSTRLPGKVLRDLAGETVLARVISRVRRCRLVNEVMIATTTAAADDVIIEECSRLQCGVFRGSEQDVLDRYYLAAQNSLAEVVVRITSDCPLIDAQISDRTIAAFMTSQPDYASNVMDRTYPRGLDTEVITFAALEIAWQEAQEPYQREHVTPFLYQHPERFKLLSVKGDRDCSQHRWTLDTPEDLQFLQTIYARMADRPYFDWTETLAIVDREPDLAAINRHILQKAMQ